MHPSLSQSLPGCVSSFRLPANLGTSGCLNVLLPVPPPLVPLPLTYLIPSWVALTNPKSPTPDLLGLLCRESLLSPSPLS